MQNQSSKTKKITDPEAEIKKIVARKKSENEALKKLLQFVEKKSGKDKA